MPAPIAAKKTSFLPWELEARTEAQWHLVPECRNPSGALLGPARMLTKLPPGRALPPPPPAAPDQFGRRFAHSDSAVPGLPT